MQTPTTPGPWKHGHLGKDAFWVGPDYDQTPVATVPWDCDGARDEARANAALLAAAPSLLDALREIRDAHLGDCPAAMTREEQTEAHIARLRKIAHDAIAAISPEPPKYESPWAREQRLHDEPR